MLVALAFWVAVAKQRLRLMPNITTWAEVVDCIFEKANATRARSQHEIGGIRDM